MTHALVSGSTGFIGRHLVAALHAAGWQVSTVSRTPASGGEYDASAGAYADFSSAPLDTIDVVFHLAGIAHDGVAGADDLIEVNVDATVSAYLQCMASGVQRFVWLSSIKVLGEYAASPLTPQASLAPVGRYASSKAQAEVALQAAQQRQGYASERLAIVRPPLVYGPGVKANFLALLRWSQSGWPLPLAGAEAGRAWVSVANLASMLMLVATADLQDQLIWHVCDDEQSSVRDMIGLLASTSGRPVRLWPMPVALLKNMARLAGRGTQIERILNPLLVDASSSQQLLGWQPIQTQSAGVAEVVAWFQSQS